MVLHAKSQFSNRLHKASSTMTELDRAPFLCSKLTCLTKRVLQKNKRGRTLSDDDVRRLTIRHKYKILYSRTTLYIISLFLLPAT